MYEILQPGETPIVGNTYLVPCIHRVDTWDCDEEIIPVIGPRHSDPQFGPMAANQHWHIDTRFQPTDAQGNDIGQMCSRNGRTLAAIFDIPDGPFKMLTPEPELRPMRCVRQHTGLNVDAIKNHVNLLAKERYETFYKAYEGRTCDGKKCPHRGVEMHDRKGHLECPLHGLRANKKTLKIIPL